MIPNSVSAAFGGPFIWGLSDCLMAPANAFIEERGIDPAASVRGKYNSMLGATVLLTAAGGYEAWCNQNFIGKCGEKRGALVLLKAPLLPFGSVLSYGLGDGWYAVKGEAGMDVVCNREVLGAWAW